MSPGADTDTRSPCLLAAVRMVEIIPGTDPTKSTPRRRVKHPRPNHSPHGYRTPCAWTTSPPVPETGAAVTPSVVV